MSVIICEERLTCRDQNVNRWYCHADAQGDCPLARCAVTQKPQRTGAVMDLNTPDNVIDYMEGVGRNAAAFVDSFGDHLLVVLDDEGNHTVLDPGDSALETLLEKRRVGWPWQPLTVHRSEGRES